MRMVFPALLGFLLGNFLLFSSAGAQTVLNQPLSQGFFGLDSQTVSGEQKIYTINLPENASWLFVGVLAMEGDMYLEVKNSSNDVFLGSGGSVAVEDARQGTYTVTVSGNGKYVVFWDYVSSLRVRDCISAGGVCKPNACSTYANCADLSSGQCDSGNCCSGSCTVQGCTLQIPPNAQPLSLDYRYGGMSFSPGETVFSVSVTADNIARIRGQVIGLTGETDVVGTWIMPDCKEFYAYAMGTDNGAMLDIRSKNSIQPNINYDYIPVGNHMFKIKANAPSLVIIWFTTYS